MEHRCGVDYPRCPGCQERIAVLEASIDGWEKQYDALQLEFDQWKLKSPYSWAFEDWQREKARAEKAEAEVERLKAELIQRNKDWVIEHEIRSG